MLTNAATLYLVDLCDKFTDNKYVVVEWGELSALSSQPAENFDVNATWKELKMNGCVVNKYADSEEVCFMLTDKARVLVQEYKVLMEQMKAQEDAQSQEDIAHSYIKTDEQGSLVVMPTSAVAAKKKRFEVKKLKKSAFTSGMLGGLISGGVLGLIFGLLGGLIVNLIG